MTEYDRVKEIVRELSDKSNILDNYFVEVEGDRVYATKLLEDKFLNLVINSLNIEIEKPKPVNGKIIRYSLEPGTLWCLFSKLQNEIKEDLLCKFTGTMVKIMEEDERIRKAEVDQLCTKKEEQVRDLEERLKMLQEKADCFEKQVKILETDNKTMKDCFIISEEECSERFELVENSLPLGLLK